MLEVTPSEVHVAPLKIRKSPRLPEESSDHGLKSAAISTVEVRTMDEPYSPRQKFQNFLRASYPFQPVQPASASTVTLPLAAGDIVLIHSIHTNGWADGTLLETGERGWLPTNYCEPYDYATMRPMLKALTEFWDIIRSSTENDPARFQSHDYMRGMVAGVRFLLEKSDCLTRDALLVKENDTIRRIRKGLLADLSLLVKASKQAHRLANPQHGGFDIDEALDDMLLKAFQVVTRAVNFFDVWSEHSSFAKNPGSFGRVETQPVVDLEHVQINQQQVQQTPADLSRPKAHRMSMQPGRQALQTIPEDKVHQTRSRPASISRPTALTHRMSYTNRISQRYSNNLASEQLSSTYDAFLGVLASFLGSHMQSRSSSELLLTTQQAVKSCRRLLEVVEIIVEHDPSGSEGLLQAKDIMYDRITDLVHAAQDAFRPLHTDDEEMAYLPEEGIQLVNAATACVSGAGRCVAKARVLLEDIGDFELELRSDSAESQFSPDVMLTQSPVKSIFEHDYSVEPLQMQENTLKPMPRLEVVEDTSPSLTPALDTVDATPDSVSTFWTPLIGTTSSPDSGSPVSIHEAPQPELNVHAQQQRSLARAMLHGSDSTLVSSARDSGPSFVSQTSTRATSPDMQFKNSPQQVQEGEGDHEEGEEEIMEHHFAHELMFNQEGRVIGGTLNALIERLTSHETTPDPVFVCTIFLTFRLFASPKDFAEALAYRFEYIEHSPRIAGPVRLRVSNVLKGWLESHWRHDCDEATLPFLKTFARDKVMPLLATAGKRLLDLIDTVAKTHAPVVPRVLSSMGKTNTVSSGYVDPDQPLPPPVLSKSQLNALKTWKMGGAGVTILDFEPIELARQLTIKTSSIYCSILPEELLGTEFQKKSSSLAVNVRAMSTLSTDLANVVADSILQIEEAKKRAILIKQWIKVAAKCLELNNYDTLMAIVCSINSSTISRLRKTWTLIGQKTKGVFEELKKVVDVSKNYSTLRHRISGHVPPCLPFVGMYLTDLTFVDHGNPATRQLKAGDDDITVINLDKHMKTAKIISDLQRFQIPYRLSEVSELQTWLQNEFIRVRAAGERNFQNHYRRSLILEPREQQATQKTGRATAATNKERFDFLGWTHINKEKTTPPMLST